MKFKSTLFYGSLLLSSQLVHAYSVVDRFKIIDDKLKTEEMLRPIDHDFIFDINASLNSDAQTFVKDISDASKAGTVSAAQNVLNKYENTEQTIKLNFNLGIPIFSFTAWDVKVKPNIRAIADVGANIGVRKDTLSASDILKIANVNIPQEILSNINTVWNATATGADLFSTANCNAYYSTQPANTYCKALTGNVYKPDSSVPNLNLFLKAQGKFGLFNTYEKGEHFFGDFNLYAMMRADAYQFINYAMINSGQKIDLPKKANTEGTLQLDYHLGYKNSNYSAMLGVEELKLSKFKDRDADSKAQVYGYDPLIRIHGQADYRLSALSLQPFVGAHKRSGYSLSDGVYGGATVGAHLWGDRLGLTFRGMLDKQYITLTPRIKLWLMQLEYSMKKPVKSTDGDVKLSAIHSIDFRLFF